MHVYREGNQVADFLASHEHSRPLGTHEFSITDANLKHWLLYI
ncbi:hypothetical protein LINPERPRIM_LOCUS19833 [Linum perenne]